MGKNGGKKKPNFFFFMGSNEKVSKRVRAERGRLSTLYSDPKCLARGRLSRVRETERRMVPRILCEAAGKRSAH